MNIAALGDERSPGRPHRHDDNLGQPLGNQTPRQTAHMIFIPHSFAGEQFKLMQIGLHQIDPLAEGLMQRIAGRIQDDADMILTGIARNFAIKFSRHALWQTAAGDDIGRIQVKNRFQAGRPFIGPQRRPRHIEAVLHLGAFFIDSKALAGDAGNRNRAVGDALLIQQMSQHGADRAAGGEYSSGFAAQKTDGPRNIEAASSWMKLWRGAAQLDLWSDRWNARADVQRRIHGERNNSFHISLLCLRRFCPKFNSSLAPWPVHRKQAADFHKDYGQSRLNGYTIHRADSS